MCSDLWGAVFPLKQIMVAVYTKAINNTEEGCLIFM